MHLELQTMSADVGETLIDYTLKDNLKDAWNAGVFDDNGCPGENEDRHCSELSRRVSVFDEKETYIAIRALVMNHWETFSKSIQFLKGRGESK